MRTFLALMIVAALAQEPIILAMKTFEVGPVQGTMRIAPQVGGVPGEPLPPSGSYILDESSNTLTDESGNKLITE
jgi:hypothetical protein